MQLESVTEVFRQVFLEFFSLYAIHIGFEIFFGFFLGNALLQKKVFHVHINENDINISLII